MLNHFLLTELFAFLLVFCRLGSAMMLLPGFGELYVMARVRLMLALMLSLILAEALHGSMPSPPSDVPSLLVLLLGEIIVGLFLGSIARMLIAAIHIAATIIAYQTSMSSALTQDIAGFQGQDTSLGNLLSVTAVLLLFVTDLHYLMLKSLADSYTLFAPGQFPPIADMANHITHIMSGVFRMAMQLAAPNIVIGLVFYLGMGILSRLMPNIQIFFIMVAPQVIVNLFIFMFAFGAIMMTFLNYFRDTLGKFLAP